MKGLRSTDWQLQNSHGDVNYSVGNIVSNTVITMVPIGYWKYQGDTLIVYHCLNFSIPKKW